MAGQCEHAVQWGIGKGATRNPRLPAAPLSAHLRRHGGVAMHKQAQRAVAPLLLLRTRLAHCNGVDELEVAGVVQERHVQAAAGVLALRAGGDVGADVIEALHRVGQVVVAHDLVQQLAHGVVEQRGE